MAMTREEMQRLASYGRNGDTMLAHINPQEAALLKSRGGAGTINPKTGLPEFYGMSQIKYLQENPYAPPEPLPTLGQALAPETLADVPTKLEVVTTPTIHTGGLTFKAATQQVSPEFAQYADRAPATGMGGGRQVEGYTVPTDKKFADIPLVAQYDTQGNFKQLTLERGQYITLDPNEPNIVSVPRINAQGQVIDFGVSDLNEQDSGSFGSIVREVATELGPILSSILAYYMPGITGALAPSLTSVGITNSFAQSVVSSALANAVVSVAQGTPIDVALQNAVTNAVVTSGSPAIARDINAVISNPAVTNAIVSAGSSAAITALNGGSEADITRNIIGGLVGSGTASATDNRVIGSFVGGAITGGVAGAITGGISTYAAEEEARNRAGKQTSEFVSGVNLAAADTGTVSDAGGGLSVEVSGTPIFADSSRAANVKTPFGFAVMPIEMADNKPEGSYYDYTQNAWIAPVTDIQKFTTMSPITSENVGAGRVSVAPGVDLTQPTTTTPSYNPNIISTGGITSYSGRNTTGIKVKPNITPSNKGTITGSNQQSSGVNVTGGGGTTPSLGTVNVTGRREETPSLDTVNVTGRREDIPSLDTVNVTGERENEIPSLDTVNVKATPDGTELPPVEDKKGTPVTTYTPKIFTYGGVESTLPTTLRTTTNIPTDSTTTGTSVGLGGRGEIESKESGKKRKNVWNEESLRLKDALGL
jgi:hypothetical protein